jgi:cyclopropane-fatty-acyl-phospholipid synthase
MSKKAKKVVEELLSIAKIEIDGTNPWDIKVHNEQFYNRILAGGTMALGESYMDGWWDCANLDQFFDKVLSANLDAKSLSMKKVMFAVAKAKVTNRQSKTRARIVGEQHYDIGNDLYKLMLDKRMNYSCGYWKEADNLDDAQEAKLKLSCEKLGLKPGMRVLDIGCGWAGFVKYAAENYGVEVVGVTISKEQKKLAEDMCKDLPVEIRLQDYRELDEKFDRIISIGMVEHVGRKNYRKFMKVAHRCLKENGLFLLHTIGSRISRITGEPWTDKYIFPNGVLPSIKQLSKTAENLFIIEDVHNFGAYYDTTLMAWHNNFVSNWVKIKHNYNDRFYRMWTYYLLSCAGSFRARKIQLWQIVFSKNGVRDGYQSIR